MSTLKTQNFDRELSLHDLLAGIDVDKLNAIMCALLGENTRLVDGAGEVIFGARNADPSRKRAPLRIELEPMGYLEASGSEQRLRAAAALVEQLLRSSARYHMASALHVEAVHADYEKLQQKHNALRESEARYKALAENLEQRVKEQVKTIETAQRNLYQAEKMASVGQLAAGVAHEINNPIGFISSNLSTAKSYVKKLQAFAEALANGSDVSDLKAEWDNSNLNHIIDDFPNLLQESLDGAERIARIVADLKGFSSVDRAKDELTDVNQVIQAVHNVSVGQVKAHAKVVLELGRLPPTRCQPGHLGQVILNIVLNAAQAMDGRAGEIRIQTSFDKKDIIIQIADNGCGIPNTELT
ncbi:MAG: two-component sensor histidine kinase, partial [Burkholderiales bacterium]|nr:two-component sensor histidine kinase [Burkholderiales bacterium]